MNKRVTINTRMMIALKNKGFTLIELLVVISIIGLFGSIVLASLDQARVKARNAHRIDQMKELSSALELYYTSNGSYPDANSTGAHITYVKDIVGLAPAHIERLPEDPTRTETSRYRYTADSRGYTLLVDLEDDGPVWCRYNTGQPGVLAWETNYPLCGQ